MSFLSTIFESLSKDTECSVIQEIHGSTAVSFSKGKFVGMISSAQSGLRAMSVRSGDKVVLIGPNSAQWIACDFAILSLGAVSVPLYSRQKVEELVYMIKDSEPVLVIVCEDELLAALSPHLGSLQVRRLDDMFSQPSYQLNAPVEHSNVATIIYTSGTSGQPKGVMLSTDNIGFMLAQTSSRLSKATDYYVKTKTPSIFHFLPLCFAGSRLMMWTAFFQDQEIKLSTDLKNLSQELPTAKPDFFLTVPAILERIRTGVENKISERSWLIRMMFVASRKRIPGFGFLAREIKDKIGKNLRFVICGSAPLSPETQTWFHYLGIPVLQVYGLTETTGIISMDEPGKIEPGRVGTVIEGVDIKQGETGELMCKGPNLFLGYWNKERETRAMLDSGWLKTGDLVDISAQGKLKISGRVKNVIVPASGHNVVPEPIEALVQKACDKIEHAVLIGHGKPYLTMIVTGDVTNDEIKLAIEQVNHSIPHYQKIKTFLHHKDGFSVENGFLTANQKIRRQVIETRLAKQIEGIYRGHV